MAKSRRSKIKNTSPKSVIPYGRQDIDKSDIHAVLSTLKSPLLTQGPKVIEFENNLSKYCNSKYAVATSNGTTALHIAYIAAGLKKGDEVIVPPNTFVATTNMLIAIGAKPVFCDIRLDTYNIDEKEIEKLITSRTRAVVCVDFAGQPCNYSQLKKIAKRHRLILIEDACHALGASLNGKKVGSIADLTIFSFHPVKSITTGEGGAVLTNNKKFYEKLLSLRSHGIKKDKNGMNVMLELGFNYRLTDIQAALGVNQLKRLDSFIKKRHQLVKIYSRYLKDIPKIILPQQVEKSYSSWHLFVIRTDPKHRDKLREYLKECGIAVNFHYPSVYSHPYYRNNGYKNIHLERADIYHDTAITLPLFTRLEKKQIQYISESIKAYFE
jgi:perosamine synthetase